MVNVEKLETYNKNKNRTHCKHCKHDQSRATIRHRLTLGLFDWRFCQEPLTTFRNNPRATPQEVKARGAEALELELPFDEAMKPLGWISQQSRILMDIV